MRNLHVSPALILDAFQEMVKAKDLPASHYDDYSLIFN
jgi:hypothetical protein